MARTINTMQALKALVAGIWARPRTQCAMRRKLTVLGVVLCITTIYVRVLKHRTYWLPKQRRLSCLEEGSADGPKNSTLGFGAIFVLAEETDDWRVQGLLEASELVGLRLTVPMQRRRSDEEISDYLLGDKAVEDFDDIRSVLNNLWLLKFFLGTELETALIMKGDTDFSTEIKSQMLLVAQAFSDGSTREIDPGDTSSPVEASIDAKMPYGGDDWDIIWLGHEGVDYTARTRTTGYADPMALAWAKLTSTHNDEYDRMGSAEKGSGRLPQQVLRYVAPMSSCAWAIARTHAQWLIEALLAARAQSMDLALHSHCKALRQRCVAPVPGLMQFHRAAVSTELEYAGLGEDWKEGLQWWKGTHPYTENIEWSARCNAARVGKRVGEKWQCLTARDTGS